uniref:Secreted protein n=1 Tax=Achlya hypogyna TaxID=1202772 RepID=A0A0A7CP67_ACHHY|nr:secreted protein [Achlya hypogyna]
MASISQWLCLSCWAPMSTPKTTMATDAWCGTFWKHMLMSVSVTPPPACDCSTDGATALFFAAQRGHSDIVYLLMSAGATAEESTLGISPKQIAQANGHTIVAAIFDTLPPPLPHRLHWERSSVLFLSSFLVYRCNLLLLRH